MNRYLIGGQDKIWVVFNSIIDILARASRFEESEFKCLIDNDHVIALLKSCQSSPVFNFQPANLKDGNRFDWLIEWLNIPYIKVCHSSKTIDVMADAFKRYKYPLYTSRFNDKKYNKSEKRTNFLFHKPPRKQEDRITLRTLNITTENEYSNDWVIFPKGFTNRFFAKYAPAQDRLIQIYFHVGVRSLIVQRLLQDGVTVNGCNYSFLGCSSEGLKLRKCLMWKGSDKEVKSIIQKCGNFNENSVSKRMSRFGLLFSELMLTEIEISNKMIATEEDIISDCRRYNFTDGCGSISLSLARRVTEEINRINESHLNLEKPPSVFKVRLQGYKGVLALETTMKDDLIKVRPSMRKFDTTSFPYLGICDYSKPFTYGNLNRQYVTLLSGLGVPDDVFEKLQESHFETVSQMCNNVESAICVLQWRKKSELAGIIVDLLEKKLLSLDMTKTDQINELPETEKNKIKTEIKDLMKNVRTEQADLAITKTKKIKILIPRSRYIFGVCDPYGVLKYGECFIRLTSTTNQIENIRGPVVVCKPPCYLKGDIRVLQARTDVDNHALTKLKHLVDCIVFPIKGPRPHPSEIAGSDLDGDKFFVSWDKMLVPPKTLSPYDYPAAETPPDGAPSVDKMIRYFSNQNKAQEMTGKVDKFYRLWSDIEGANSDKCEQLAMRFSRVIDAAKTGASCELPEALKPPDNDKTQKAPIFIWSKLEEGAENFRKIFQDGLLCKFTENEILVEKDLVDEILSENSKLSEFDKFRFAWQLADSFSSKEDGETTLEFFIYWYREYINFSSFTQEEKERAFEAGIPENILVNDLNMSQLLTEDEVGAFSLHSGDTPWKFYFQKSSSRMDWPMLTKALTSYDNSCIVIGLPSEMVLVVQFYNKLKQGLDQDILPGTISALFFSRHFGYKYRHTIGGDYQLDFTNDILQIYRNNNHSQSFVWLKTSSMKQVKARPSFDIDENLNCLSVDLSRFNKQINQNTRPHPLLTKVQLSAVELFVRNESYNDEFPPYYDVIDAEGEAPCVVDSEEDESLEQEYDGDLLTLLEQNIDTDLQTLIAEGQDGTSMKRKILLAFEQCNFNQIEVWLNCDKLHNVIVDLYTYLITFMKSIIRKTTTRVIPVEFQSRLKSLNLNLLSDLTLSQRIEIADLLNRIDMNEAAIHFLKMDREEVTLRDFLQIIQGWQLFWYMDIDEAVQYLDGIAKVTLSSISHTEGDIDKLNYILHFGRLHCLDLIYSMKRLKDQMENNPLQNVTNARVTNLKLDKTTNTKDEIKDINLYATKALAYIPRIYVGQNVLVCRHGDTIKGLKSTRFTFIGKVVYVMTAPFSVQIEVSDPFPDVVKRCINTEGRHKWQVTVIANIVTYLRVVDALKVLYKCTDTFPLFSILAETNPPCTAATKAKETTSRIRRPLQPSTDDSVLYERERSESLDHNQDLAVRTAVSQQITCITGPPGTGKSKVACDIVRRVVHMKKQCKVLVVAETNNAVDNLARQLRQTNHIVRVGPVAGVAHDLYDVTLEGLVKHTASNKGESDKMRNVSGILLRNTKLCYKVIDSSSIVMSTCSAVADPILKKYTFDFVLVDEASIVLETTLLCSLIQGCKQLVLIGDHMQLSPFVNQHVIKGYIHDGLPDVTSLSETLFHRLTRTAKDIPNIVLLTQYRMHEKLLAFPSNEFYDGILQLSESVKNCKPVAFMWPVSSTPICFIDTNGRDDTFGSSFRNISEARLVADVVNRLLNVRDEVSLDGNKLSIKQITVLTFYQAQVKCIKDLLRDRVTVNTVDGFQGCENDVIVASTVRANRNGTIGFTGERNRLNVLFTRAKRGLIVIGDEGTLCKCEIWRKWLDSTPKLAKSEVQIPEDKPAKFPQKYEKPYTDSVVGRKARRKVKYKQK